MKRKSTRWRRREENRDAVIAQERAKGATVGIYPPCTEATHGGRTVDPDTLRVRDDNTAVRPVAASS